MNTLAAISFANTLLFALMLTAGIVGTVLAIVWAVMTIRKAHFRAYCTEMDDWFEANKHIFKECPLNLKQQKVLYALAQCCSEHTHLRLWKILMLWGWDGTAIDRLRFDVDLEELSRTLIRSDGGSEGRYFSLTESGRNFLLHHRFI